MSQEYDFEKMKEGKEISGYILRKIFGDPISKILIKHTSVRPNQVTLAGFVCIFIGAVFLSLGGHVNQAVGSFFAFIYAILDLVDGNIARVKGLTSKLGKWLDGLSGFIAPPLLIFSLSIGIDTRLSLILGSLAMIAFPLHFLIVYFYKLDIIEKNKSIEIDNSEKSRLITRIYGTILFYIVLFIFALLNQSILVLWLFAFGGNLFWILTATYLTYSQYKRI